MRSLVGLIHRYTLVHWRTQRRYPGLAFDPSVRWETRGAVEHGSGVGIGRGTVIAGTESSRIRLADGAWLGNDCEVFAGGLISVGRDTSLQHRTQLHGDVRVGAGCVGAANFYASSSRHAFRDEPAMPIRLQDARLARRPWSERTRPIVIEDDCWLGINVVVNPGVTVGRGCVIGANSVVTHDVEPYAVVAGAPATVIGRRLAFIPPAQIDAALDADLPYFYRGFSRAAELGSGTPIVRREQGGLRADPDFALAVAIPARVIALSFIAPEAGTLRHGEITEPVSPGAGKRVFPAAASGDGRFAFEWRAQNATHGLVVTSAGTGEAILVGKQVP